MILETIFFVQEKILVFLVKIVIKSSFLSFGEQKFDLLNKPCHIRINLVSIQILKANFTPIVTSIK